MAYSIPTKETAFGCSEQHTKTALRLYKAVLNEAEKLPEDQGGSLFRNLIKTKFSNTYEWMLTKHHNLKRINLPVLFSYLFPNPHCPHCSKPVKNPSPKKIYCNAKCMNLHLYGISSKTSLPETQAKMKATLLKNHGVEHPMHSEKIKAKTKATSLDRYGFSNPMQSLKVQAKSRVTNFKKLGVAYPAQNAGVKAKKEKTCLEKYGSTSAVQNPLIRAKITETLMKNHGVAHALQVPEFKEKAKATSLKNFGVENPLQSPVIKAKAQASCLAKFGVTNPMSSPEVRSKVKATNLKKYGVEHVTQDPEIRLKITESLIKNHGVAHALQVPEFKEKAKATLMKNFGVSSAMQSPLIQAKRQATCLEKFGATTPLASKAIMDKVIENREKLTGYRFPSQNPEIAEKQARSAFRITDHVYEGRAYSVQSSYEKWYYQHLVKSFGIENVHTQYHDQFPKHICRKVNTRPDIYIESVHEFIEVKCAWTLLDKTDNKVLDKNKAKAKRCHESDVVVRWVVVHPTKNKVIELPQDWYIWDRATIEKFVTV